MPWFAILVAVTLSAAAKADCLDVQDNTVEEIATTEFNITTAEWTASVHNACDEPYDGILTIRFKDPEGTVVHEALEIVIVQSRGSENARRTLNIPTDSYGEIQEIEVAVDERERPR